MLLVHDTGPHCLGGSVFGMDQVVELTSTGLHYGITKADIASEVQLVADVVSEVQLVADVASEVWLVADVVSEVQLVEPDTGIALEDEHL